VNKQRSGVGTFRTSQPDSGVSAVGGRAEVVMRRPTSEFDPTETLSDRLEPVAFDGDEGLLRRQRSAAANEKERRTNRHVP
jgi:hypothetical protein